MGWTKSTQARSFDDTATRPNPAASRQSAFKRLLSSSRPPPDQLPIAKPKSASPNFVNKFITTKGKMPKKGGTNLVIPTDIIAQDLKKKSNFAGLVHNKLFGSNNKNKSCTGERKALCEVKSNTRTLAMVLRSERELLALNKEHESRISQLDSLLEQKYTEVEKLKDLCLKQREEIRSLKSAVLFPDTMNVELEEMLEKQGSELKQAKQLIPSLQRQVTSLTGQLHSLAVDLAEVKADKFPAKSCYEAYGDSPKTPTYDQHDAINSLEFSSEDQTTPDSPDDMFTKDFNPCLTPYSKTKSNEYHGLVYESPRIKSFSRSKLQLGHGTGFDPYLRKVSKSSDCCKCSSSGSTFARTGCRSDETKSTFGNQ